MHLGTIGYEHIDFGQSLWLIQSTSAKLNKNKGILPTKKKKNLNNIQNYLLPLVTTRNREKIINRVKI
jgi:hypothetical protein